MTKTPFHPRYPGDDMADLVALAAKMSGRPEDESSMPQAQCDSVDEHTLYLLLGAAGQHMARLGLNPREACGELVYLTEASASGGDAC